MPARPGAFTANFAPDTLNKFRETCKRSGLQYTKVLEELATLYLESEGQVLHFQQMMWDHTVRVRADHTIQQNIVKFLESKGLLDVATKKELAEYLESAYLKTRVDASSAPDAKAIEAEDNRRFEQLIDSSIDTNSPPDELTTWEEGYSDLHKKLKVIERDTLEKIRDSEQHSFRRILNLNLRVAELEEKLSKLQSKISD